MAGWRDTIKDAPAGSWRETIKDTSPPDTSPHVGDSPTREGLMSMLDSDAKSMGYKDQRDMSDKIGQGVMGGQIGSLAGPAIGAAKNFVGRLLGNAAPVAAEAGAVGAESAATEAPAIAENAAYKVSNAGPIKNLPRPGSSLFGEAPVEATTPPPAGPISRLPPAAEPTATQATAQKVMENIPGFNKIAGGASIAGGVELYHLIKSHPEIAGAGLALTPPVLKALIREQLVKHAIKSRKSKP